MPMMVITDDSVEVKTHMQTLTNIPIEKPLTLLKTQKVLFLQPVEGHLQTLQAKPQTETRGEKTVLSLKNDS